MKNKMNIIGEVFAFIFIVLDKRTFDMITKMDLDIAVSEGKCYKSITNPQKC